MWPKVLALPFALVCSLTLAGESVASTPEKPFLKAGTAGGATERAACSFPSISQVWDFAYGSQGFAPVACDEGGASVWEYGWSSIPGAPGMVWGTVLSGNYPDNAGQGLVSPYFTVTDYNYLVQVDHYFETESVYDGCNVRILPYDTVIQPIGGYTVAQISPSTSYYAYCVDGEPGWTGSSAGWRSDCFDLSAYMGSQVALELDFGSDASVTMPGWYLARVVLGGQEPTDAACCIPGTGMCYILTQDGCTAWGGVWHPEWATCSPNPCPLPPGCTMDAVAYDWDFAAGAHGFTTRACDTGGAQVWEYGDTGLIPGAPPLVWGTVLNGNYPDNTGAGLLSPSFTIGPSTKIIEVLHYYDTESSFDGCNLSLYPDGTVVTPAAGYPISAINSSGSYYAWCVDGEPGWTGQSGGWRIDCFDLSAYSGTTVSLEFDFGSDASVTAAGWYLAHVRVGGDVVIPQAACCDPWSGLCRITTLEECAWSGGIFHSEWTSCDPVPCPQFPPECAMPVVPYDWDFLEGGRGFEPVSCDAGGTQVWEYGPTSIVPGAPGRVWGTILEGNYPDNAGAGLRSPTFTATETTRMAQLLHWFETEYGWDGCNVTVQPYGTVIAPIAGYTVPSLSSTWCVRGEPGWTGSSGGWRVDCFDLSAYMGQSISLEFDFGSDGSVTHAGWYLARVRVGGAEPPPGPPDAPSNVLAETLSPNRVRLSWEDNSDDEDVFVIDRKAGATGAWQQVLEVPANSVAWEDPDVSEGVEYYYRIRARDGSILSVYSNFANAYCGLLPAAPTSFYATPLSPIAAHLTWVDNATNESGFQLQVRRGEFLPWEDTSALLWTDCNQYNHYGLNPNSRYAYRIRSYNQFGFSAWTTTECVTPADPGNFYVTIVVKKGTTPMGGVTVTIDHGSGFVYAGTTDSFGECYIPSVKLNDRIRASYIAQTWYTCRDYRLIEPGQDMGMRTFIDTDTRDGNANLSPYVVNTTASVVNLQLSHAFLRFDLGMSTEWDMLGNDPYWAQLRQGCQTASDYLWDVSDGQMALGQIAVWDNQNQWGEADVRIESANILAHADLDNFMDCDSWSSEEHMFLPRNWPIADPAVLIHESGHYILDLKDEYETGWGGQAQMDKLKKTDPGSYPMNYGFMDEQWSITEMSSKNDYRPNYDYNCGGMMCPFLQSEQLFCRGESCWDQVKQKLEGWSSYINVILPQAGWFVSGSPTSPDREGPTASIGTISHFEGNSLVQGKTPPPGPPIDFIIHDSGPGSAETDLIVRDGDLPVPDARVFRRAGSSATYLGKTDTQGRLHAVGLRDGDEIHAYARMERGTSRVSSIMTPDVAGGSLALSISPRSGSAGREEETGPGAVVDVTPSGPLDAPLLRIDLWTDETLSADPSVKAWYGRTAEPVAMQPSGLNRYYGQLQINPEDPDYDGNVLFEFALQGIDASSVFVSMFVADEAVGDRDLEVYTGTANLNLNAADVTTAQVASGTNSNSSPYRPSGFDLPIVGDSFSLHLSEDDDWPSTASFNVSYPDSLLGSIDERSLRIYRWNSTDRVWQPVQDCQVSTEANVVSAPLTVGGVYCVAADAVTDDSEPPAPVDDFGAVPSEGLGAIELLWTASGDDGHTGSAEQYMVAYSDSAITLGDWNRLPVVTVAGGGHPAGAQMRAVVRLPRQDRLYHLAMRAKDEASNLSDLSNLTYVVSGVADANLVTAPPERLRAVDRPSDEGGAVALSWRRSRDDGAGKNSVIGYRIYRADPPGYIPDTLAVVAPGTTSATDAAATNGIDHVYWVSAIDATSEIMGEGNRAFATRNSGVPAGDFTGDAVIGVNDFGLLIDTFAIDSTDAEFDPLFDLDHNMEIADGDFDVLKSNYPTSGNPTTDPAGENAQAHVYRQVHRQGSDWRVDLTVRGVSNLAGYSFRVRYPNATMTFNGAQPDSGGAVENILRADGGITPLFMVAPSIAQPGLINVANAIQRPSEVLCPEGDGYLGAMRFSGSGIEQVVVYDFVLMDAHGRLNYLGTPSGIEDGATILRPHLYAAMPNPFFDRSSIRYQIPTRRKVRIEVYDVGGRQVRSLVDRVVAAGVHEVLWDGRDRRGHPVASGVYLLRLDTERFEQTRKIVRLQ
jgi:hypothetical protein